MSKEGDIVLMSKGGDIVLMSLTLKVMILDILSVLFPVHGLQSRVTKSC